VKGVPVKEEYVKGMLDEFEGRVRLWQSTAIFVAVGGRDCSGDTLSVTAEQLVARFVKMYRCGHIRAELLQHCNQLHQEGRVVVNREQWDKAMV
jgi:hypothetical protein